MKLIDGLKLKGRPAEIPDCSRNDLPQFFVEMGYKVGAEIGVYRGEFSEKFAQVGLALYAVDPWQSYKDYEDTRGQERLNFLYEHTKRLLAPYPKCKVVRKTSMEAVEDFADESLDFVYIDGNHQFRYITDDLCEWSKKVRKGGVICGHDYIYTNPRTQSGICHVIYVLNAYTQAYKIDNWYVLGRKHPPGERVAVPDGNRGFYYKIFQNGKGEIRDRFRSWMWVK